MHIQCSANNKPTQWLYTAYIHSISTTMYNHHLVSCSKLTILLQLREANHHHTAQASYNVCKFVWCVHSTGGTCYTQTSNLGTRKTPLSQVVGLTVNKSCSTHQCKQAAFPWCSLHQSLCTRTFHLCFVGNFGNWDVLTYHHQQLVDSPHPWSPATLVDLVDCTTLLKGALVLCFAHNTLSY